VNICCVFVGDISFEIKTEADSNDVTEYQHADVPSTGMIVFHYESILCTSDILLLKIINTLMLLSSAGLILLVGAISNFYFYFNYRLISDFSHYSLKTYK